MSQFLVKQVAILGAGAWGTALGIALAARMRKTAPQASPVTP